MMQKRILLTSGRAPATLELARLFSRSGHLVFVAESIRFPLTRYSNCVTRHFYVPQARFEPDWYTKVLEDIIRREQIDIFIPTCEEILYASRVKVGDNCHVWVEDFKKLDLLHNKWTFIECARELGLAVPQTTLIKSRISALDALSISKVPLVLKPVYSRFASQTVIWKPGDLLNAGVEPTEDSPWVAQKYIEGSHLCTYSVAHKGTILAHAAYSPQERWGMGSSTLFEAAEESESEEWVRKFVAATNFTGQIAFDLIRSVDGVLYPIECNPRITSGVHLFSINDGLVECFLGMATKKIVRPQSGTIRSIKLALFVRCIRLLFAIRPKFEWLKTLNFIIKSRDVLWDRNDPFPAIGQFLSLGEFLLQSMRLGISPNDIATHDIGYNGKDESL